MALGAAAATAATAAAAVVPRTSFRRVIRLLSRSMFPSAWPFQTDIEAVCEQDRLQLSAGYLSIPGCGNGVNVIAEPTHVHWELAPSSAEFDPERYLGELKELPASAQPGDWCTVVVDSESGELRFTLVVVDPTRSTSLFAERRNGGRNGGSDGSRLVDVRWHVTGREGTDGISRSRAGERGTRAG
jgi:hypothetical protein